MKSFIHSAGHACHIGHKCIPVFIAQFKKIVHMIFIRNQTTATVSLFLKQKNARYTELSYLNHQTMQCIVILAIQAFFGVTLHDTYFYIFTQKYVFPAYLLSTFSFFWLTNWCTLSFSPTTHTTSPSSKGAFTSGDINEFPSLSPPTTKHRYCSRMPRSRSL